MVQFMVLAAPRSGTSWAAAWLTTDNVLCVHEPLTRLVKERLDELKSVKTKKIGVACTALALWPAWVNSHPARKVILHRDPEEVRASMARLGIDGDYDFESLQEIKGLHLQWTELFSAPELITSWLGLPFDAERHAELKRMNIQDESTIQLLKGRGRHALATA